MTNDLERKIEVGDELTDNELEQLTPAQRARYLIGEALEEQHRRQLTELDTFLADIDQYAQELSSTLA
jgi:hypothetical protein